MSLAVVLKGPEGIVLAADSRVTLTSVQPVEGTNQVHVLPTYFDNATKLMGLQNHAHLAIVTYGSGSIGVDQPRMVHGYIPEFEAHLGDTENNGELLTVERAAQELGAFFAQRWNEAAMPEDTDPMAFLVAGYDDGEAYGKVYEVSVPNAPQPVEQFAGDFAIRMARAALPPGTPAKRLCPDGGPNRSRTAELDRCRGAHASPTMAGAVGSAYTDRFASASRRNRSGNIPSEHDSNSNDVDRRNPRSRRAG